MEKLKIKSFDSLMGKVKHDENGRMVISTTELCEELGGLKVSVDYLMGLGLEPSFKTATGVFWLYDDIKEIGLRIAQYTLDRTNHTASTGH